jgi:hypothetical protein
VPAHKKQADRLQKAIFSLSDSGYKARGYRNAIRQVAGVNQAFRAAHNAHCVQHDQD